MFVYLFVCLFSFFFLLSFFFSWYFLISLSNEWWWCYWEPHFVILFLACCQQSLLKRHWCYCPICVYVNLLHLLFAEQICPRMTLPSGRCPANTSMREFLHVQPIDSKRKLKIWQSNKQTGYVFHGKIWKFCDSDTTLQLPVVNECSILATTQ